MSKQVIAFNETEYTEDTIKGMNDADLLGLRNLVASNLGVASIKSFKNHEQAVKTTWNALVKWETDGGKSGGGDTKKKEAKPKKPQEPAKCAGAGTVKRPTRGMFRKLTKIKEHPGKGFRIRRWDNYKDGMTLVDTAEGDEMTPLDVGYYVDKGFMKLTEPTEEEYQAGLASWYKKHGLENPEEAKAAKAKAREEAKAAKAEEREAKAKARAEAKEAKAAEAQAKKETKAA